MTAISSPRARHINQVRGNNLAAGPWWWIRQIISWLVLFFVLAVVAVMVVIPRIAGGESFTVLSGSMKPGIQPGDLVVVKPVAVQDITIGSVLTYQLNSGQAEVVTHRVIGLGVGTNGERSFQMQGDANNTADQNSVRPVQIRGMLWYSLPLLGYLNSAISGEWHMWLLGLAVAGLFSYAAVMLFSAWRDRQRRLSTDRGQGGQG